MSAPPPPPPPLPAGPEGAAPAAPANSTHSTVYVGHLSPRTERRDVEELFEKYGRVISVELKHGGFAFVEYCPEASEKGMDVKSGKCFKCGQPGHLARYCRGADTRRPYDGPSRDFHRGPPPPPRYGGRGRSPPHYGRDPYDYGHRRGYSRSPDRGYGGPGGYRQRSPYHPGGGHGGHGGYRGRSPSPYYRDGGRGRSPSPYG
ncbi:hypothetical protein BKA57DRAFT_300728 [Linnemannia elongata]|nr:hypothetical protein BKA57DRAFT_300728 [Linnemannia elongata]